MMDEVYIDNRCIKGGFAGDFCAANDVRESEGRIRLLPILVLTPATTLLIESLNGTLRRRVAILGCQTHSLDLSTLNHLWTGLRFRKRDQASVEKMLQVEELTTAGAVDDGHGNEDEVIRHKIDTWRYLTVMAAWRQGSMAVVVPAL